MRGLKIEGFSKDQAFMTVCTFLLALSMLVVLGLTVNPIYAGTLPSPVKKPLPLMVPKGPVAEAVKNRAELRIVSVDRIGSGPIQPGQVVSTNVVIANSGRASATVSAASVGISGSVNRSRVSAVIPSRGQAIIRLDIPVEARQIRANQFRTTVGIVKPNVAGGRRGWLDQIWKDGNKNDNAMEVRYPVDVSVYAVTAVVTRIHVLNDCDSDGPGEWGWGAFYLQSANSTAVGTIEPDATHVGGYYGALDGGERKGVSVFDHLLGSNRYASLNTGQVIHPPHAEVRLQSVGSRQYVLASMETSYEDDGWVPGNDYGCGSGLVMLMLTPEQWQRGGNFYKADKNFRVFFTISARPASLR